METPLKRLNLLKGHISPNRVSEVEGKMHIDIKEKDRLAICTWDFPNSLNALSPETIGPFLEALNTFEADDRIG